MFRCDREVLAALSLALAFFMLGQGCGGECCFKPDSSCYIATELYAVSSAITDSTAARDAFLEYLDHLDQTNGYPVFGWVELTYLYSDDLLWYKGHFYWGIVAWGRHHEGWASEARHFRVRDDGSVVLMLGCI